MDKLDRSIPPELLAHMETLAGCDFRVGQMFDNISRRIKENGKDIFYVENDELLRYFRKEAKAISAREIEIRALILSDKATNTLSAQSIEYSVMAQSSHGGDEDEVKGRFISMIAAHMHQAMINWKRPFSKWSPPCETILKYYSASKEEPWFEDTITVKEGDREEVWKVKVSKCLGGEYVG